MFLPTGARTNSDGSDIYIEKRLDPGSGEDFSDSYMQRNDFG